MKWLRQLLKWLCDEPTIDVLKRLTDGLGYRSESDDTWAVFAPQMRRTGVITPLTMERLTGLDFIQTKDFETFMDHCIATQPQTDRYIALKEGMVETLGSQQVFVMSGRTSYNQTIYVAGIDFLNNIVGCYVGSVET